MRKKKRTVALFGASGTMGFQAFLELWRRREESDLRRWASLRLTFIMPSTFRALLALFDPISFHMPIDTRMENITDRDAGLALVNSLDVPAASPFWRRAYDLGGGPGMRVTAYRYLADTFAGLGLRLEACMDRDWFALRNFHLQYFEDSDLANHYLRYQRDTLDGHAREVARSTPFPLRLLAGLAGRLPFVRHVAERIAHRWLRRLAEGHRNSPLYWYRHDNDARITAFFEGTPPSRPSPTGACGCPTYGRRCRGAGWTTATTRPGRRRAWRISSRPRRFAAAAA